MAAGGAPHWPHTLAAKGPQVLQPQHLHWPVVPQRGARLHLIVLDRSGSMQRSGRLAQAKGFAAQLIAEAARSGDRVALLAFGGQGVQLVLAPGPARAAGVERVRPLGGGGGTPLLAALHAAERLLRAQRGRVAQSWLWLLCDGRTRENPPRPQGAAQLLIVDFDDARRGAGRCAVWAAQWGAQYRRAAAAAG